MGIRQQGHKYITLAGITRSQKHAGEEGSTNAAIAVTQLLVIKLMRVFG